MVNLGRVIFCILVIFIITYTNSTSAQNNQPEVRRTYDEAEKLYLRGNYQGSIDYIDANAKSLSNSSDSLLYLKIINLEHLYKASADGTRKLESTINTFFSRARKYIFPDNKYDEVVAIYTKVQQFKEADRKFFEKVNIDSKTLSIALLSMDIEKINTYIGSYKNSYYSNELNEIVANKSAQISQIEKANRERLRDSTYEANSKIIGKKTFLTLSYAIPIQKHSASLNTEEDVLDLLNSNSKEAITPTFVLGGSLFDLCGNLFTIKRFKIGMIFTLLDFNYHTIEFGNNTILQKSVNDNKKFTQIVSINAGTRIGLMASYLLTKRIAVAPYFQMIPSANVLYSSMAYEKKNETAGTTEKYEIKQQFANFNLSNELGLRFYFFESLYLGFFVQNGLYNWANTVSRSSVKDSEVKTKADYKFQTYGIRLGF